MIPKFGGRKLAIANLNKGLDSPLISETGKCSLIWVSVGCVRGGNALYSSTSRAKFDRLLSEDMEVDRLPVGNCQPLFRTS